MQAPRNLAEIAIAEITEEGLAEMHPLVADVPHREPHPRACPRPSQYGRKIGKLLKGAEPDVNAAAKLVLHDWQRAPRCSRDSARCARDRREIAHLSSASAQAVGFRTLLSLPISRLKLRRGLAAARAAWRAW